MTDIISGLIQETISGIALGSIYALIALGFTLIYKATEVVNFSQGEIMMVGAYVNFFFLNLLMALSGGLNGWIFLLAFIGSVIFAVLFGIIIFGHLTGFSLLSYILYPAASFIDSIFSSIISFFV